MDNEKMVKKILMYTALVVTIPMVIYLMYCKFTHPDMTETRFFLSFWPWIILNFISLITFMKIFSEEGW